MTPPPAHGAERKSRLREEASRWLARAQSNTFSASDGQALREWLEASTEHEEAYAELLELWDRTERFRNEPELLQMREAVLRRYPAGAGRRRSWRLPAVASVGGALAAAAALFIFAGQEPQPQTFRTGVGQTATITLIDGSRITLDTDTEVHTFIGAHRRDIRLDRGRAFFKVAKDASKPFVVEAAGRSVAATGTAFEVRAETRRFEVVLVEGHVRVTQTRALKAVAGGRALTADLEPGTRLTSMDQNGWSLTKMSGDELAWMNGELLFDNRSLADIAQEMNRYSRRKIVIADEALAGRKIIGAFAAGDVDQFTRALVDYKLARLKSENESEVVLGSPDEDDKKISESRGVASAGARLSQ